MKQVYGEISEIINEIASQLENRSPRDYHEISWIVSIMESLDLKNAKLHFERP
jgi:hypothetical protein